MDNKKILVVDDEAPIRNMLITALGNEGYVVRAASGAEEAIEILKQEQFSVMLLDIGLEKMNGFELCEKIREVSPNAIIYALTGFAGLFPQNEFRNAGFDEYFQKPIGLKDLKKIVKNSFEYIDRLAKNSTNKTIERILIIDDDDQFRRMLRRILEDKGYAISEAASGEEGILRFSEQQTDLIIVDIVMPGKNGIETIVEIKEANPEAKFIVVSGGNWYGLEIEFDMAQALGAHALKKPFKQEAIIEAIEQIQH